MSRSFEVQGSKFYPPGEEEDVKVNRPSKAVLLVSIVLLAAVLVSLLVFVLCVTDVIDCDKKEDDNAISIKRRTMDDRVDGKKVYTYRLRNEQDMEVEVMTLGAAIGSITVPDKDGKKKDVSLGFYKVSDFLARNTAHLGSVIGRVAGPISGASFDLNGQTHNLTKNDGDNHRDGAWDDVIWDSNTGNDYVELSYTSPAGTDGYPGALKVGVIVQLTPANELFISIAAKSDADTIVNPTMNICFNMAGEGSGDVKDHEVTVFADSYLEVDDTGIPTGNILAVNGTIYDLDGTKLSTLFDEDKGIDDYFLLAGTTGKRLAARVKDTTSGRQVDMYTNQPGVTFSTGDNLDVKGAKMGKDYSAHAGVCLNGMNYPDAINQPGFPSPILLKGSTYEQQLWYAFTANKED